MTKIVGIDFGTTNVRIAQWDIDGEANPDSCQIGSESPFTMPAVIAFQRQQNGDVNLKFGEEADTLEGAMNTEVVRNIKRYALMSDDYVLGQNEWYIERHGKSWPTWFDLKTKSISIWNETISVEKAIKLILKEAISMSGLAGVVAEWRAGCPVSSDLSYRKALISALDELGCKGKIKWISEEPLLLLALGRAIGSLGNGYFVVYDLGGGSFDCAIVEVKDDQLIVLADEGLPALGGMDIDEMLENLLEERGYDGDRRLLRIAKEQLSSDSDPQPLPGGYTLTLDDINEVLDKSGEEFINETLIAMVNAYNKAQILREDASSGKTFGGNWQESIEAMSRDVDKVLVVGGPTRMPYFTDKLSEVFGADKVVTADELVQNAGRGDIADAALTALSHGACYMYDNTFIPLTVDRVPATITLEVTNGQVVEEDSYVPFNRLPFRPPLAPFEGRTIVRRHVYGNEPTELGSESECTFSIKVTEPDGGALYDSGPLEMRMPRPSYKGPRADRISLVVDRLGGVKVNIGAGFTDTDLVDVVLDPPWQPELQQPENLLKSYLDTGREFIKNEPAAQRVMDTWRADIQAAYGEKQRRA